MKRLKAKKFFDINSKDLPDLDDSVSDEVFLDSVIDGANRSSPFVYFDNTIWGKRGSSHESIIKDIVKTKFDGDEEISQELFNSRLGLTTTYPIACGHIIDDVAVVDLDTIFNCSADEVKQCLLSNYPINKVYFTSSTDKHLQRVAKKYLKRR